MGPAGRGYHHTIASKSHTTHTYMLTYTCVGSYVHSGRSVTCDVVVVFWRRLSETSKVFKSLTHTLTLDASSRVKRKKYYIN